MAEQAVIFPDRPLFMVDRGWQRRKKKAGKDSHQQSYERELDLQPSRVPEITIAVVQTPNSTRARSLSTTDQEEIRGQRQAKATCETVSYMLQEMSDVLDDLNRRRGRSRPLLPVGDPVKRRLLAILTTTFLLVTCVSSANTFQPVI